RDRAPGSHPSWDLAAALERWAALRRGGDRTLEPVAHARTGERPAGAVREYRRSGIPVDSPQPSPQLSGRALPQRDRTLLASHAVQMDRGRPVEEDVADTKTCDLRDTGPGVVHRRKQHRVALPAPGAAVWGGEDCGHLVSGQVAGDRLGGALRG